MLSDDFSLHFATNWLVSISFLFDCAMCFAINVAISRVEHFWARPDSPDFARSMISSWFSPIRHIPFLMAVTE